MAENVTLTHGRPCILKAWWGRWGRALRSDFDPGVYAAICERMNMAPDADEFSPVPV